MDRRILHNVLFIVTASLVFLFPGALRAEDELLQTGVVKSVDAVRKTVIIDVKSTSCLGIRKFTISDPDQFMDLINKSVDFVLDSSVCRPDQIYGIDKVFLSGGSHE